MTQKETKILKTDTIQDVFNAFPEKSQELASIMTSHGLHCVGCHASVFETLEQGILGHGFSQEKLESMLIELNSTVAGIDTSFSMTLTEKAAEKITALLEKENKKSWGLRFGLEPDGSFQYQLSFREFPEPDETTQEIREVKIFVARKNFALLKNSEIDFVEGEEGAGFKITNPNESKSSSCCD